MAQKWWIVGGAAALGALVFGVALWMGAGGGGPAPGARPAMQPGQTPPGLLPGQGVGAGGVGTLKGYTLRGRSKQGYPVDVTGETLDPLPQDAWKIGRPLVRVYVSENRLVQIQAEGGTILAPGNQPRSGELTGLVTVFVFEGPGGRPVDSSYGSRDMVLRLRLEQARFDLELGQIESDGPIELSHTDFEFKGRGLVLTFNQLRQRIEHLEVFEGKSLRLHTSGWAALPGTGGPETGAKAAQSQPGAAAESSRDEKELTYYQAQLLEAVTVDSPEAKLRGDLLSVWFALRPQNRPTTPAATPGAGATPPAGADGAAPAGVVFQPRDNDLAIAWTGRMIVEPMDQAVPELEGGKDALLALAGKPVDILTREQDHITAGRVDYLMSSARVRLLSEREQLVVIESKELGKLTLPELVIDQKRGVGTIRGGGVLQGKSAAAVDAGATGTQLNTTTLPQGMSIAWADRLDMSFYTREGADSAAPGSPARARVRALKDAVFLGQVQVKDERLDLRGDRLAISLSEPGGDKKQELRKIVAQGNVRVDAQPDVRQPAVHISTQELQVDLARGAEGKTEARRFFAAGNVDSSSDGKRIQARTLEVLIEPAGAGRPTGESAQRLRVSRMTAEHEVRITDDKNAAVITGALVTADVPADVLDVKGVPGQPARLRQSDAALTSDRIVLDRAQKTIRTPAAGAFVWLERDAKNPQAQPTAVTTRWVRDMSFDQKRGEALFRGEVRTESQSARDTTRLTCQELAILFDAMPEDMAVSRERDLRQVKTIAARQNVKFQAESWLDQIGGKRASRFTLEGPDLLFQNDRQSVQIIGPGLMLVEDERPDAPGSETTGAAAGLRFTGGKGATLFTWQKQFMFDVSGNDLTMEESVRMTHKPAGSPDVVKMDCSRFIADLESTGGMSSWSTGRAPTPGLKTIQAFAPVEVTVGGKKPMTIQTDKLTYHGETQIILLQANPGAVTTLQEPGKDAMVAEGFSWNLKDQRLEVFRPAGMRVPLGK